MCLCVHVYLCLCVCVCVYIYSWLKLNPARGDWQTLPVLLVLLLLQHLGLKFSGVFTHVDDVEVFAHRAAVTYAFF